MGKLIITTNSSLDGVIEDPDGQEGFRFGGWFNESGGADLPAWSQILLEEALSASAVLLGRHSDEWFAARWQTRDGVLAERLNSIPKYVVSTTAEPARWSNSTVLTGDAVERVAALKQEVDGDVLVYASYRLGRTLVEHDLVDELRLMVLPVVVGSGDRLFGETSGTKALRLVGSRTVGENIVFLTYRFARNSDVV